MAYFRRRGRYGFGRRRVYRRRGRSYGGRRSSRRLRVGYKRRRFSRRSALRVRSIVCPKVAYLKFRYIHSENVTSAAPNSWEYIFRGNSIYDPNYATGGTHAQGAEQWSDMYTEYQVYAAKVTATYYPASQAFPTLFAMIAEADNLAYNTSGGATNTTASTSYTSMLSDPLRYLLGARVKAGKVSNGNASPQRLKAFFRSSKVFDRSLSKLDGTQSLWNNNPQCQWFLHFLVRPANPVTEISTSLASGGTVNVKIVYYVKAMARLISQPPSDTLEDAGQPL